MDCVRSHNWFVHGRTTTFLEKQSMSPCCSAHLHDVLHFQLQYIEHIILFNIVEWLFFPLQLRITLIDTWNPDKVTDTFLTLQILRNVHAPQFSSSSYTAIVYENIAVGRNILQVNATDADGVSSS